jgi:hypothetical protein
MEDSVFTLLDELNRNVSRGDRATLSHGEVNETLCRSY